MNRRDIIKISLFAPLLGLISIKSKSVPEPRPMQRNVSGISMYMQGRLYRSMDPKWPESGNTSTTRVQIAEELLRQGYITTPEEYMKVIEG